MQHKLHASDKHILLSFILPLILWLAHTANAMDPQHRLETKSAAQLADAEEFRLARLWSPPNNPAHLPDHWGTRLYSIPDLTRFALISDKRPFDADFSWTSVSLLSLPLYNLSYILLGGSWSRHDGSPYPREDAIMRLCNFTLSPTSALSLRTPCQDLLVGVEEADFMGAASTSLKISETMGLIAYCDPLWRGDSHFPAGRCYLQLLHNQHIRPRQELSFCRTGGKVTEPCMTGFSVDLQSKGRNGSSFADVVKGLQVIVGQPLASRVGRAQILADPFYSPRTYTVYMPDLKETSSSSYFGYAVAGDYISALSGGLEQTSRPIINQTESTQLFKVQILLGDGSAGAGDIDWLGQVDSRGSFSGFGTSMVRLANVGGKEAILVGAPFSTTGGRVYLFCVPHNFAMNGLSGMPTDRYHDYVSTPANMGAFGYALSVVGDLDGDGIEDVAVGSPQRNNETKAGRVFLLRIRRNCTFDRRPLQQIDGPKDGANFGSVLPHRGADMDFNGWPDFALTVPRCESCNPMVFASRPRFKAACRFYQPNWLESANVQRKRRIPIKLKVRLLPQAKRGHQYFSEVLRAMKISPGELLHQINPDLWAKDPSEQRLMLHSFTGVKLDHYNNLLTVLINVFTKVSVEDMPSLEQPEGAARIQYRFNIPCPVDSPQSRESKTCINNAWVYRPLIDWTDCNFKLRLSKYVCFPRGKCESDMSIRMTDAKSGVSAGSTDPHPIGETLLIYGDKEGAMHELTIDVFNRGPTFAGGVWINFVFSGNLRFSAFETGAPDTNGSVTFKSTVCSHPLNNDTWVACNLGRLAAPLENVSTPLQTVRLTSFYASSDGTKSIDYSTNSYVNASILSQTFDPSPMLNSITWNYRIMHAPKYLITTGFQASSSVVDNRTRPPPLLPGFHHRIRVEELGPKLNHTFQVEHTGPSRTLVNVTIRVQMPVSLTRRADDLVYLFNEIRSPGASGTALTWVSMRPVVRIRGGGGHEEVLSECWYDDETLVNPNRWIGIEMSRSQLIRPRRSVGDAGVSPFDVGDNVAELENHTELEEAGGQRRRALGKKTRSRVIFRRVPKEVIQCGRIGHKFGKPICAEVVCHLKELVIKRPVQISVTGWLYAPTFFDHSTSDIEVVTTLIADQGAVPKGVLRSPEPVGTFEIPQIFYFPQLKPDLLCQIPIWPIIVGLVLGSLLLTLLIIILYKFGFFRRRKHKLAVSGRRRWHENLDDASTNNRGLEDSDGGAHGVLGEGFGAFGSVRSAEEARKRRLKLRKHPEEVSILHPDELPNDEGAGTAGPLEADQDNITSSGSPAITKHVT